MKTKGDTLALIIILPMLWAAIYLFMAQAGNGHISVIDEHIETVKAHFAQKENVVDLAFKH